MDREPTAADVSAATIRKAAEAPSVVGALQAARSSSSGLRRAELAGNVLRGARVLWVDDHPENNAWERELLRSLGVVIVSVESTRSAVASLRAESFDVMISDIRRDSEPVDGIDGAMHIRDAMPTLPIVFYIQDVTSRHIPEPASGLTNEPNELLHLLLDRLERTRI